MSSGGEPALVSLDGAPFVSLAPSVVSAEVSQHESPGAHVPATTLPPAPAQSLTHSRVQLCAAGGVAEPGGAPTLGFGVTGGVTEGGCVTGGTLGVTGVTPTGGTTLGAALGTVELTAGLALEDVAGAEQADTDKIANRTNRAERGDIMTTLGESSAYQLDG